MSNNPERIHHVSHTQLSIARFYGGCKYNGDDYIYIPSEDVLVRADIFKKEQMPGKKCKKETPQMKWANFLTASESESNVKPM